MIKLSKQINNIIKKLESNRFRAYAAGDCVRQSMMGLSPLDWDIITNAPPAELAKLFPGASPLNKSGSIVRLDYTEEDDNGIIVDIISLSKDEDFMKSAEKYLRARDFTVNAIGDNPSEKLCDPFNAREDISKKLIRATGDPQEQFARYPIRMLRAIRLASEMGFDLAKNVYEAIVQHKDKLSEIPRSEIRDEFEALLQAPHAGKGLRMLATTEVMYYIVGDGVNHLTRRQNRDFYTLCDNIHKIKPALMPRLALFFMCFDKWKGRKMLALLEYEGEQEQSLTDSLTLMETLYFVKTEYSLKKFLVKIGQDRYNFINSVAKAQRIVYDFPETKILARYELLKIIRSKGDPIFVEELAVTAAELEAAGIASGETAQKIMLMLTDTVHKKPYKNEKNTLLLEAKKLSKNWFALKFNKIRWLH